MAVVFNDSGLCGNLRLHHFYRHDPARVSIPLALRSANQSASRMTWSIPHRSSDSTDAPIRGHGRRRNNLERDPVPAGLGKGVRP